MTLFKTSALNAIAVVIKILTLLGLNKILAVYVGPAGYAALGQFQNAVQMLTTFGSGAITTGVTKYTAEYHDNEAEQHKVWRTAGTISVIGSLVTALLIIVFNQPLAGWFLRDESLGNVFILFAASLTFFVLNTLLLSILNGKKEIGRYVTANIAGSLFSFIVTSLMAVYMGVEGALIALAIYQSLAFVVTLALTYQSRWFKFSHLFGQIDKTVTKNLLKFTAMALTSAATVPLSHILIRDHLGGSLGWDYAGYWEAMWRLSAAYLMFVTTTLSVYYLPRLSELTDPAAIRAEIMQGYKVILPIAVACGLIMYVLRDFIIQMLFSVEFLQMEVLFGWQMIGDTLKIGSWILSFIMLGKGLAKLFISTQIIFAALFYGLTVVLSSNLGFGLEGAGMAHALTYLIYWVVMYVCLRSYMRKPQPIQS